VSATITLPAVGLQVPLEIVLIGLVTGMAYGLMAIGLTLTYRSSRVINFAHGQLGALAAAVVPFTVFDLGLPYAVGLVAALCLAAGLGLTVERLVFRPLASASRLLVLVATIAVAQALFFAELLIPRTGWTSYPTPVDWALEVGSLRLGPGELLLLLVAPVVAAAVMLFLQRSKVGVASRAAAENRGAALLAGIPVARVSAVVFVVASVLAGVSAVLVGPTRPVVTAQALGPTLMVYALAAALLGGFSSITQVFLGGVALGVVQALTVWNYPSGGLQEVVLLVVVLGALLLRRDLRNALRAGPDNDSLFGRVPDLARAAAADPRVRRMRRGLLVVAVAGGAGLPAFLSASQSVRYSNVLCFATIGLSLVVLTGFAGQVSLGNFTFVALGAVVTGRALQLGYPFWVCALYAVVASTVVAVLVGVPALRIRGLYLAVATLAFAIAAGPWIPSQHWLVAVVDGQSSMQIQRPTLGPVDLGDEHLYSELCLVALLVVTGLVSRLRRSGVGRSMMAVRDNARAAASMGISPTRAKLTAFAISGAIAGLGGVLYGGLLVTFAESSRGIPQLLQPEESLTLLGIVVVGGVTSVSGPLWGALVVLGGDYLLTPVLRPVLTQAVGDRFSLLLSAIGVVFIVISYPQGVAGAVAALRDRLVDRRLGLVTDDSEATSGPTRPRLPARPATESTSTPQAGPALSARAVVVRFGGITAVDDVSIDVSAGSIVGLVGPNGAGKSTLFDVLTGQLRPQSGRVELHGQDITGASPHERARAGLGRTFQDARLFGDMTLREVVKVASEADDPASVVPSLLGLPPARDKEGRVEVRATELIELLGLGSHAERAIAELSTGTRRLVELACIVAGGADVLLLDEPTAGLAQREAEAFMPVLRDIRDYLDATIVLIDHDIPLVAGVVDELHVMVAGRLLSSGPPQQVLNDEAVIAAYLGVDERAIARSGAMAAQASA
jgi:ABC-type branched-subunit amino acid transport system ATPase component/ABC-type branched-subunit amino acid transport system permease subunit